MLEKQVIVKNSTGLHARPATVISKKAGEFKSDIKLEFNGKVGNLKSLIGILSLGISKDASVKVMASGEDEVVALKEIATLIETLED
ncbi:MAG: HPr family phosphocarrier protein [Clostridium perfringens]|nr:HPr family phosphocarrier protein [Clostridium perfringens]